MISDQTHDGIRELEFDAVCYVPKDSVGSFSGDYITNTDSELYDEYTGMWLTAASSYGDSERGDNYYLHTVSANGKTYDIEFAYSTDWQNNVDNWASVLTKSYVVYLPEDYDGLILPPRLSLIITRTAQSVCSLTAFLPKHALWT